MEKTKKYDYALILEATSPKFKGAHTRNISHVQKCNENLPNIKHPVSSPGDVLTQVCLVRGQLCAFLRNASIFSYYVVRYAGGKASNVLTVAWVGRGQLLVFSCNLIFCRIMQSTHFQRSTSQDYVPQIGATSWAKKTQIEQDSKLSRFYDYMDSMLHRVGITQIQQLRSFNSMQI